MIPFRRVPRRVAGLNWASVRLHRIRWITWLHLFIPLIYLVSRLQFIAGYSNTITLILRPTFTQESTAKLQHQKERGNKTNLIRFDSIRFDTQTQSNMPIRQNKNNINTRKRRTIATCVQVCFEFCSFRRVVSYRIVVLRCVALCVIVVQSVCACQCQCQCQSVSPRVTKILGGWFEWQRRRRPTRLSVGIAMASQKKTKKNRWALFSEGLK